MTEGPHSIAPLGFTTIYKTAETAKLRGRHTRLCNFVGWKCEEHKGIVAARNWIKSEFELLQRSAAARPRHRTGFRSDTRRANAH